MSFNKGPLARRKIITVLCNQQNLLIEKHRISILFLTRNVMSCVKSRMFHYSLPKALSTKHKRQNLGAHSDSDEITKIIKRAKQNETGITHINCALVDSQKLLKEEERSFLKIFNCTTLLSFCNYNSGYKIYCKQVVKCYYFMDCNNKASNED